MIQIEKVNFNQNDLVPVIAQDSETKDVLMLAYMNKEALELTLKTGYATYYSRSRKQLWKKGETSGHLQKVVNSYYDCDQDAILLVVEQCGVACHTGSWSCFTDSKSDKVEHSILNELYETIIERKNSPIEGSYTAYLFEKGIDKILKKVGEETSEVIIGAKNEGTDELIYEISDLVYHVMVLMVEKGVTLEDIRSALLSRKEKVKS
ncbi:bifunctional phosphoribosyl-AMP cyclohydrolase/phosphoribosyl-ATP pyrophosphatase [Bacillus sp. AFS001701]|uniref:bifunctional phosphoribosyl-AMP cyclohydrolase/phosphoribosyl-ATP diphosphatase HisIE n=1 Tax=Bacillaceae TaxID=186817 RepID=UPI000BF6D36C|nr:bifunctional phosphoribosyl-AMP cyclohydrolase/phosphoribosyl-ATP diphosphatase HisIE [Bacillus sp. AFS001701]PET58419.1 bifunctional phosphoribosyl-AMP cyclohydrolase/phosphoribosyl-ATP pyrophosphatase [Bacillus sp. AFS001701]